MADHLPPDVDQALEQQQELAEASLPSIFEAYDDAIAEEMDHPVVIVIDCEDQLGAQISRAWLGDETVDEAIAMQAAQGEEESQTTVFVAAFAFADCRVEACKAFPYLSEVFDQPPGSDGVLVVSITAGGASALTAPMEARPE